MHATCLPCVPLSTQDHVARPTPTARRTYLDLHRSLVPLNTQDYVARPTPTTRRTYLDLHRSLLPLNTQDYVTSHSHYTPYIPGSPPWSVPLSTQDHVALHAVYTWISTIVLSTRCSRVRALCTPPTYIARFPAVTSHRVGVGAAQLQACG